MANSGVALTKSEATRQKLLDHAMNEAIVHGPDRVGFTAIAKSAGMSTGALYSRYENVDELLIDLWSQRGEPALREMTNLFFTATDSDRAVWGRGQIVDRLNRVDSSWMIVALLMTVARRNDALREVVAPDVANVIDSSRRTLPTHPQILASVLGCLLTTRGVQIQNIDWSAFIDVLCGAASVAAREVITIEGEAGAYPDLQLEGLDEFDEKLFAAATEIIGRVGIDSATISRIARRAGVNPASIYARHHDKEQLLAKLISTVLVAVSKADTHLESQFLEHQPIFHLMVKSQRAVVDPAYESTRNLRLELIYAAGHHEQVREALIETYRSMGMADTFGRFLGQSSTDPLVRPFMIMGRALMYGNALLLSYGYLGRDEKYVGSMAKSLVESLAIAYASLGPAKN